MDTNPTEKGYKALSGNLFTSNALFLFYGVVRENGFSPNAFKLALGVRVIYFRFPLKQKKKALLFK